MVERSKAEKAETGAEARLRQCLPNIDDVRARARRKEDIEDCRLARRRRSRGGPRVTLESLERDLEKRTKD